MKRNWDKIRDVLQAVEEDRLLGTMDNLLSTKEQEEICFFFGHLLLCLDAKLVDGILVYVDSRRGWRWSVGEKPVHLTMKGHDMLEALRKSSPPRLGSVAGVGPL